GDAQCWRLRQRRDAGVVLQLQLPGRVLLRSNELGGAEMRIANDDLIAKLVGRAKQDAIAATERPHPEDGVVAQPHRSRVTDECRCRRARDEPRSANDQAWSLLVMVGEGEARAVAPRGDLGE